MRDNNVKKKLKKTYPFLKMKMIYHTCIINLCRSSIDVTSDMPSSTARENLTYSWNTSDESSEGADAKVRVCLIHKDSNSLIARLLLNSQQ